MPKQRITKEMVLDAAFEILRERGEQNVLVKNIAAALSCSVQPIYSYCENMDTLRQELALMSAAFLRNYVAQRIDPNNLFESTGKAHVAFAKEYPHVFKSYFLRVRSNVQSLEDLYTTEASPRMAAHLAQTLHITERSAKTLHMNMIIYSTGLSFMMISAGGNFSTEEVNEKLTAGYKIFLKEAQSEKEHTDESYHHL